MLQSSGLAYQAWLNSPVRREAWHVSQSKLADFHIIHGELPPVPCADFSAPFDVVPTLFIAGGRSSYIKPEHKGEIDRLFPGSKHLVIPNAGHWVHAEAPAAFMAAVGQHLLK